MKPQSAPDLQHLSALHDSVPDEPEGIFINNNNNNKVHTLSTITNKDKIKINKKQKKLSETEKRLINSPLAQPLVKH